MGFSLWRAYLSAPGNAVAHALRQRIAWRRGPPQLVDESKRDLFSYLEGPERAEAEARERRLRAQYGLRALFGCSRRIDYLENLYLLDLLERVFAGAALPGTLRALDVGAKNWSYVFALQRFLVHGGRRLELSGVEIDAHVVYADLRSRYDYAQAYLGQTGQANGLEFLAGDVLDLERSGLDLVTCFYPFLTPYPLLRWGLPLTCLQPKRILTWIEQALRPGGQALIVTHTAGEAELLPGLLPPTLTAERQLRVDSRLVPYHANTRGRRATLLRRT